MKPWALVPVKRFDQGKSRLGETLDPHARGELARAMFDRVVVRVLAGMTAEGELGGALVVTDGEEVRARAQAHGISVLVTPGTGAGRKLGAIVDEGLAWLSERGVTQALVIMGDLPELTNDDVRALAGMLDASDVVLAPDASGRGTNALAMRLPPCMPTRFCGGDSLADHVHDARARGLRVAMCERPGFGFDVDQPEDYARLREASG